jgi:hypothetical protein
MPAKRTFGMDQDFYPWSPIVSRPVLRWPDNARVALAVIVNLEHWDWEVSAGTPLAVSPTGGPEGLWSGNQPQFPDIGGYGNHEYGNRVGIFRILAVLDKYRIKPTLALDKAIADHYPFLVNEGRKRGAEFIAHGLSRRRIIQIGMSEDRSGRISAPRSRRSNGPPARARSAGPAGLPGDAEHPQLARGGGHSLCLRLGQRRTALPMPAQHAKCLSAATWAKAGSRWISRTSGRRGRYCSFPLSPTPPCGGLPRIPPTPTALWHLASSVKCTSLRMPAHRGARSP